MYVSYSSGFWRAVLKLRVGCSAVTILAVPDSAELPANPKMGKEGEQRILYMPVCGNHTLTQQFFTLVRWLYFSAPEVSAQLWHLPSRDLQPIKTETTICKAQIQKQKTVLKNNSAALNQVTNNYQLFL